MTTELRLTPQRRAVLDALRASVDHPTAQDVLARVRRTSPGIGAATVYRALNCLVENGQALEVAIGPAAARYDANTARHDHVVCVRCGAAADVDAALPARLPRDVARVSGFAVTGHDLTFTGFCPTCQHDSL
ncbi:MAG: Fur family transcriptional regulator, peroxide stress response regulator [Frankiaceae bacterium]|jgi:Fur family ferric uptake transcriptional regulator/Fur family peroxide stress response transcriptional regulator|nr:Fur family transcriptional regulator, peroxide stress response regulator [Frankiaceae bacterium]